MVIYTLRSERKFVRIDPEGVVSLDADQVREGR
jgi:hypothetical protein